MTKVKRKKNAAGFMEKQLKLLLHYCHAVREKPKISFSKFHKAHSNYSRVATTSGVINKAYKRKVINGPFLFVNSGIEIQLLHDVDNPLEFFEKCKRDEKTTFAVISHGYWPILLCKKGANTLQYHDSILPSRNNGPIFNRKVDKIFFEKKGKLHDVRYPHGWYEDHWDIFHSLRKPREVTYREAEKKVDLSWVQIRNYFLDMLTQCKVITTFFPLGAEAYSPLLVTFKTDYETGIVKGLRTLNRTTYLYKTENTIILLVGTSPVPKAHNHITGKFQKLEEKGVIHDFHVSTPINWHEVF